MNWSAVGAAGEVLGAVAVVVTLVYLARQVRLSNRIARAEAYRSTMERIAASTDSVASDPALAEALARVLTQDAGREDLSATERAVVAFKLQALVMGFSVAHHDVQLGILPESATGLVASDLFSTRYMREVWPFLRGAHPPEFRDFFERRYSLPTDAEATGVTTVE